MLQQTRMEVVLGRYQQFLTRFPTIGSLASSTEEEVTAAWSGLGLTLGFAPVHAGLHSVLQSVLQLLSAAGRPHVRCACRPFHPL